MNSKQKKRLVNILKHDCACAGNNKVRNMTCAIGAMAVATLKPQSSIYRQMIRNGTISDLTELSEHLQKKFGLEEWQLTDIQEANDYVENEDHWPEKPNGKANVAERRAEVLRVVKGFKVTK